MALESSWTIAEPRQASKSTIPEGKTAVYLLKWEHGQVTASQSTVDISPKSKPDIRMFSPSGAYFKAELKCGFTGSASEGNSNSTKVAADVDLVAEGECDLFCGLFDAGMLDRVQGRVSRAGRGAELKMLLGDKTMSQLHPSHADDHVSTWRTAPLNTSVVPVVCRGGIRLALVLVRLQSAQF
jgi:hypothetical protein